MKQCEWLGVAHILSCHILLVIISHYYTKLGSYIILMMNPHNDDNKDDEDELEQQRRMVIAQAADIFVNTVVAGALIIIEPLYNKTPYHTSALTGADWVQELLASHDRRIQNELGVYEEVFQRLLDSLTCSGIGSVATAIADVFRNNGISVGRNLAKILKIFEEIDEAKSRGVI
jgi:hypothetical protein